MAKAIRMYKTGGPEVMVWEDYDPGKPGPGEAFVRHEAVGLNFIDVNHRTGLYPLPSLPATPGMEGAWIVEAAGEGVTEVRVGDRVAYAGLPPGAYAQERLIPAHRLVKLPESIPLREAAGMMLRGMTSPDIFSMAVTKQYEPNSFHIAIFIRCFLFSQQNYMIDKTMA